MVNVPKKFTNNQYKDHHKVSLLQRTGHTCRYSSFNKTDERNDVRNFFCKTSMVVLRYQAYYGLRKDESISILRSTLINLCDIRVLTPWSKPR